MKLVNSQNIKGIYWMISAAFTLSLMAILVNHIKNINGFIIFTATSIFASLISLIILLFRSNFTPKDEPIINKLNNRDFFVYVIRASFGALSMIMWFHIVKVLPINNATAISFLTPLLNSVSAMIFLKETVTIKNFSFILLGFFGAIIMLQPILSMNDSTYVIALLTVCVWVITDIITKIESNKKDPLTQCFYVSLFTSCICIPFLTYFWKPIIFEDFHWLIIASIIQFINLYSLFKAYSYADINILVPFDFTRLIFTSLLAYFILGETIKPHMYFGALIILISITCFGRNSLRN